VLVRTPHFSGSRWRNSRRSFRNAIHPRPVVRDRTAATTSECDPRSQVVADVGALYVRQRLHQHRHPHGPSETFRTPFIFSTLGAMAFLVFFTPTTPPASPRSALCGNAVGIACGYGALWVTGLQHAGPATDAELSWTRILAVSPALATTSALMILLNVPHPPAAATAMFAALGVVTRPTYLVVLEAAVALLVYRPSSSID
jgi:HPP family